MADRAASPYLFFALVFLLSVPIWALGAVVDRQIMPGLPVSALIIVCPLIAALMLRWREAGSSGAAALLARAFDFRRNQSWLCIAAAVLLMPALSVTAFAVSSLTGTPPPLPQFTLVDVLLLCLVFFVAASMEEIGWAGYVTAPLQMQYGALGAGLIIGALWAVWHYIPLAQADRSVDWIAWWTLGTVAVRVFMVALYNAAGSSVFILSLLHMSQNVSWQLYPVQGSYYDPQTFSVLFVIAAVIGTVAFGRYKRSQE
ncbi:MAG: CPBP family glutamic-type intramembrane protease [Hyphococcus sp.]